MKYITKEEFCDWIEKNKHYKVVYLDYDYANSNYHTKKGEVTKEVLVINY